MPDSWIDAWMPCPDGIRLASRLWYPPGDGPNSGGPWPVLLMRQPYGRAIASTVTYAHPSWYAQQGFLVVVQDVRGRGESEGRFGGFAAEAADGAAAVRWARGLEGSSGRVGTYGFSYQGTTQLLNQGSLSNRNGQPESDPLPDCLVPAMCGLDERLHWASEAGAHWWALGLGWALQLAAEGCRRRNDGVGWLQIRHSLESGAYLREGITLLERHDPDGMGLEWLRSDPALADGWRVHGVSQALLRRPMLLIGGWHDPHLRGVLEVWRQARLAGGHPQLRIGAWSHLDWQGGIDALQLAFFLRHLLAETPGALAEAASPSPIGPVEGLQVEGLQCVTTGRWSPLPAADAPCTNPATPCCWSLHSHGLAAVRSDEGQLRQGACHGGGQLVVVHDPWRPVPGRGGHLGADAGVVERGDLDRRSDVACFTTASLSQPLELLGEPRLAIRVSADQPGFDLCGALSVLSADGSRVRQISSGLARFRGEGCRRSQLRQLRFQPLFASLEVGERLRLTLAGAAWPQIAVNPGDGTIPLGGTGPGHRVISLCLELEESRLWLNPLLGAN